MKEFFGFLSNHVFVLLKSNQELKGGGLKDILNALENIGLLSYFRSFLILMFLTIIDLMLCAMRNIGLIEAAYCQAAEVRDESDWKDTSVAEAIESCR